MDREFARDGLKSLLGRYTYSSSDQRARRPNPTAVPIEPDRLRQYIAFYRSHLVAYARFAGGDEPTPTTSRARARTSESAIPDDARTFAQFDFDGAAAFERLLATSQYGTLEQAVASLAVFSHPDTVRQTGNRGLFPTVRGPHRLEAPEDRDGRTVVHDDNKSPTDAFLWANCLGRRGRDTQFNHIYAASQDPDAYTALPNLCMTPAFIAKLTDTHANIRALLRYRSFDLYGWTPRGVNEPPKPDDYDTLEWAEPLPAVADVRAALEAAMVTKPKDRTVRIARRYGWLYGKGDRA